ncbi:MAG: dihydroxy-acid dehydratase [Alphaproteobacteria bacterium]|nr:dihydroxy-acid dehydratase [Alphaproteobacteria bacterium]
MRVSKKLRSQSWFDPSLSPAWAANADGRPVIGIAQTGSDLVLENRHHLALAPALRAGIEEAGGIPLEFPVHPMGEGLRRPSAGLDRNLGYLGLVEILHGYPLDGVVLTTGSGQSTAAALMAAASVNIPAILLSCGPMLNSYWQGARKASSVLLLGARDGADKEDAGALRAAALPSAGHDNMMGAALAMNALSEGLGLMLPGGASIPAPLRARERMAYDTGRRAVALVEEDLRPSRILTRDAFINAIRLAAALGAPADCVPHLIAAARHMGVELTMADWRQSGNEVPLLVNCMPAGEYLAEDFHEAGGVPSVLAELIAAHLIAKNAQGVSGRTIGHDNAGRYAGRRDVIRTLTDPLRARPWQVAITGNFFESAVMTTGLVDEAFRRRHLSRPGAEGIWETRVVVFEGPEDYEARINDPALGIDEDCILVLRFVGPVGYPGAASLTSLQPPEALRARGLKALPVLSDAWDVGPAAPFAIHQVSPEAATGGYLAFLRDGDRLRIDMQTHRIDALVSEAQMLRRQRETRLLIHANQTPWQEIYRKTVGPVGTGACIETAMNYLDIVEARGQPRG